MATRPCKPGADVKRIWQLLLPDAPFPACGTKDNPGAEANEPPPQAPGDGAPARRD
jgi:hypothetical protein